MHQPKQMSPGARGLHSPNTARSWAARRTLIRLSFIPHSPQSAVREPISDRCHMAMFPGMDVGPSLSDRTVSIDLAETIHVVMLPFPLMGSSSLAKHFLAATGSESYVACETERRAVKLCPYLRSPA